MGPLSGSEVAPSVWLGLHSVTRGMGQDAYDCFPCTLFPIPIWTWEITPATNCPVFSNIPKGPHMRDSKIACRLWICFKLWEGDSVNWAHSRRT